jgi:hypothetical protein
MGVDCNFEVKVIWGVEIHLTSNNIEVQVKFLHNVQNDYDFMFPTERLKDATDDWIHIQNANKSLLLKTLCCLKLLRSGKSIEVIRAEIEINKAALAAWDKFVERMQQSCRGLCDEEQVANKAFKPRKKRRKVAHNNLGNWIEHIDDGNLEEVLHSVLSEVYRVVDVHTSTETINQEIEEKIDSEEDFDDVNGKNSAR